MDYIDRVIDTFRADHPELDADLLREFAHHVRRVVKDEIRDDSKSDNVPVHISMQLNGASFSAKGPRWYVDELLERWHERADRKAKGLPPAFNRMQIVSGPGR